MEFTGERFIPGKVNSIIHYEHVHRYLFARQSVEGKAVLDVGCGEGYGCSILATAAASVDGIDISPEAIGYASMHRSSYKVNFAVMDAQHINFPDASFDVVTCFENIEHVPEPELVLAGIARVLRPSGIAFISSPNKAAYHKYDPGADENHYHVREFEAAEFKLELMKHFKHVEIFNQGSALGSLLWSDSDSVGNGGLEVLGYDGISNDPSVDEITAPAAIYSVAIVSKEPLSTRHAQQNLLTDNRLTVVRNIENHLKSSMTHGQENDRRIIQLERELDTSKREIARLKTWVIKRLIKRLLGR